jgi:predicted glycoside hydrolase/deacetylase ChbG (UPF0249 family)
MARLLIVNADDYGLTQGVSRAILRGHEAGIITSTSLLALAPGFEQTVGWLDDAPGLGLGAHLAAVGEDPPLLSAGEIPTLVDERGRLRMSWKQFLPALASRRIDLDDVRREFAAQLERILAIGRPIDHLDTHQNLHLWPGIAEVLIELGERHDIRTIRVTRSRAHGPVGLTVRRLAARLEATCDRRGWAYPATSTGLDEAGSLALPAMLGALARLADQAGASAELATHPGEAGDADLARYEWGYRWGDELEALCNPALASMVDELGFTLGTFADLVGDGSDVT